LAAALEQAGVRALPGYGLIYRGEDLTEPLTLAGPVTVRLTVSSDCPDTDFVAKVVEVDGEGRAVLLVDGVGTAMSYGRLRRRFVDCIFAGVGAVIVFLPQILILFLFILVLESSGYMVRAAFLMDRLMSHAGLSGRAFIPLLSSFACAVPGIMATRTIADPKDRLTPLLVAPLVPLSAPLPLHPPLTVARTTSGREKPDKPQPFGRHSTPTAAFRLSSLRLVPTKASK